MVRASNGERIGPAIVPRQWWNDYIRISGPYGPDGIMPLEDVLKVAVKVRLNVRRDSVKWVWLE